MKTLILTNQNNFSKGIKNQQEFNKKKLKQEAGFFLKYTYLCLVAVLLCVAVIEIKHIYQIDIFPSIDTPFDNLYYQHIAPSNY